MDGSRISRDFLLFPLLDLDETDLPLGLKLELKDFDTVNR